MPSIFETTAAGPSQADIAGAPGDAGSVAISDVTITEGDSGTKVAVFTVTRTGGTAAFAVDFATEDESARAGSDYVARSGSLNFAAGVNSQTVSVTINGDTRAESHETFEVFLFDATNEAVITNSFGWGTIIDDDGVDDFADDLTDPTSPFGQVVVGGSTTGSFEGDFYDLDWFRISLTADVVYSIHVQGQATNAGEFFDPTVAVFNDAGQRVADDDSDPHTPLSFTPSTSGTYYIQAFGRDAAYTVRVAVPLLWSALTDGQVITGFDPASHVLLFDSAAISAAEVTVTPGSVIFDHAGKTVTLDMDLAEVTTANITFEDSSKLMVGDNRPGVTSDNSANVLSGLYSGDQLIGLGGNDSLDGASGDDVLYGGSGNDSLDGWSGNDTLNGGAGNDTLVAAFQGYCAGDTGDDLYILDFTVATVFESANAGTDTVRWYYGAYTLGANVENLVLRGDATDGTGNTLANSLTGNERANTLSGDDGNDNLDGESGSDSLDGGSGDDTLEGDSGDDTLNGGLGIDHMSGGAGNDIYIANNSPDVVIENDSDGTDRVRAGGASYTLGANVEGLTLTGSAGDGTGNELNNVITGNSVINTLAGGGGDDSLDGGVGNDILDGGSGNDTLDGGLRIDQMSGGAGNDLYIANNSFDVVTENANEGTDHVMAGGARHTLGANVEHLTLTGSGGNGTGNDLNNVITGNSLVNTLGGGGGDDSLDGGSGNDILRGGSGNDTLNGGLRIDQMSGGAGNDLYIANNSFDTVTENADEGTDHVLAGGARHTLGANVENLTLTDRGGNGTGNELNNVITGNSAANQLAGGAGNDTLAGGLGNDTLMGGSGGDRFVFDTALNDATNVDVIRSFNPVYDALRLDDVVFTELALGTLSSSAFRSGAAAQDASDRIIYNSGTGAVLFDSDGTGAAAAVRFATLTAGLAITNSDFIVV